MKLLLLVTIIISAIFVRSALSDCDKRDADVAKVTCVVNAAKKWNVTNFDFSVPNMKSCCFIWDSLECQLPIYKRCDPDSAKKFEKETVDQYRPHCVTTPRKSPKCKKN